MDQDRGLVTFFDIEECGFYRLKRNSKDPEHKFGTLTEVLEDLCSWLNGKKIEQTLPWDPVKAPLRAKTYCRGMAVDPLTKDSVIVVYRAVGDHAGSIHGIKEGTKVGPDANETIVAGAEHDGDKIIWGQPCYYWFIPEHNKFASIRFPHSSADTGRLASYVRDHVNNNSLFGRRKQREILRENPKDSTRPIRSTVTTFPFEEGDESCNCLFKFKARELKFNTLKEDLDGIHGQITHTVIRDTTRSFIEDTRTPLLKIGSAYLPSFFGDSHTSQLPKKIEVIVDGSPSIDELHRLFEIRDEDSSWNNIGFKIDGPGSGTTWLSEYTVKTELVIHDSSGEDHYSPELVLNKIKSVRQRLLSQIVKHVDDSDDYDKTKSA